MVPDIVQIDVQCLFVELLNEWKNWDSFIYELVGKPFPFLEIFY